MKLFVDTDLSLVLEKLTDQDNTKLSGATVEATIYELDGTTEVGGVTWPITLSELEAGKYEGTIPWEADLKAGHSYEVVVTAEQGGAKKTWFERVPAGKERL